MNQTILWIICESCVFIGGYFLMRKIHKIEKQQKAEAESRITDLEAEMKFYKNQANQSQNSKS